MDYVKRFRILATGIALAGIVSGVGLSAQETKEAQGEVTAVTDTSFSIKSAGKDLTFMVTPETLIEAKGAGTRSRQAKTTGTAGIKITDFVKAGSPVVVRYQEAGGQNRAVSVRPVSSAGPSGAENPTRTASGKVKGVTGNSLTIDRDGKDMTFVVDGKTDVVGRGAGTATKQAGGKTTIMDLVHNGDTVSVSYHEAGGTMTASTVRITVNAK